MGGQNNVMINVIGDGRREIRRRGDTGGSDSLEYEGYAGGSG